MIFCKCRLSLVQNRGEQEREKVCLSSQALQALKHKKGAHGCNTPAEKSGLLAGLGGLGGLDGVHLDQT
jgi:hypothetical protein